ncbi:MAG: DUF4399 domain-containing protein [bacterium]
MNRSPLVLLAFAAAACEGKKAPAADSIPSTAAAPAAAAPPAAAASPGVRIVAPTEGATTGADVTVVLGKENVTIAKADGGHVEGTGHYHLFLDSPPSPDGAPIPPNSATTVHIGSGDSTYTFKGLKPGPHQIIVVLGYGDHAPMATRRDTVKFVVK